MKLCVYGGSGKLGQTLIEQAVARGHEIIAPVRKGSSFTRDDITLLPTPDLFENSEAMKAAINGCDAVISALGTTERKPNTILSDGTAKIMEAAKAAGCQRLLVVTSFGCRESVSTVKPFLFRQLIVKWIGKHIWADKNRQEDLVEVSGLDYTIIRPTGLSDDEVTGKYQAVLPEDPAQIGGRISRANVAHFILEALDQPSTIGKIYTLFP
ncbi:MAG: SDR family oxidoreductase [Henriciella sp.]